MAYTFSNADQRRMYGDLSWAWPIICPPDDYVKETEEYVRLVRKYARIPVSAVANFGCGGGHNDFTLKKSFEVTGVDISDQMISLARELNPEITYVCGDMRSVRLGRLFDAVTAFDAINYMQTIAGLKAAIRTAFSHLRPGGAFVTQVQDVAGNFRQCQTRCSTHSRTDTDITLLENYYDPDPSDTWYEALYIYLIRRSGELTMETDIHHRGLFPMDTWRQFMKEAGFELHEDQIQLPADDGGSIPALIGVKPIG